MWRRKSRGFGRNQMSKIFRVHQGSFGHVSVLELTTELVTHAHSTANVSFWLQGAPAHVLVNGVPVGHDADNAAIIDRFVPHCLKIESRSGAAQSLSFYLDPEWLARVLPASLPRSFTHLDIDISRPLREELWMLRDMLLDDTSDEVDLDCALTAFLGRALLSSRQSAIADTRRDHSAHDFRIRKALALMRGNMMRNLDMEAVAREVRPVAPAFFFDVSGRTRTAAKHILELAAPGRGDATDEQLASEPDFGCEPSWL